MSQQAAEILTVANNDWDALCQEYQDRTIGPLWLELITDVCERVAKRYSPIIYNDRISWDESSIEDLVQQVVLDRMLEDGQIHYIVATVSNTGAACGLVGMHVKQVLAQRVLPNQRDNVAGRLFALFEKLGEVLPAPNGPWIRPIGTSWTIADPTPAALRDSVRVVAALPRLPNRGTDRLSPLFTTDVLREAVEPLWGALQTPVTRNMLRAILDEALTGLLPAIFQLDESYDQPAFEGFTGEDVVIVDDLAHRLVIALDAEQREILVNIELLTDSQLAKLLGVSRPTALKRRHGTRDVVGTFFAQPGVEDLPDQLRGAVLVRAQSLLGGDRHE